MAGAGVPGKLDRDHHPAVADGAPHRSALMEQSESVRQERRADLRVPRAHHRQTYVV